MSYALSDRQERKLERELLCNFTEGGVRSKDVDPDWALGCHGWYDSDERPWYVTVDADGVAWTWCAAR